MPHSIKAERNCVTKNKQTCTTSRYPSFFSIHFDLPVGYTPHKYTVYRVNAHAED